MVGRLGWLRAAVLGANDGLLSTSSLIIGVASASAGHGAILVAGAAGLIAGSMSMAAGEYVSVSSQRDAEQADLQREKEELRHAPEAERDELERIYVARGLDADLARAVAAQLTTKDALAAHARDELGLDETSLARPIQAAFASALAFAVGAAPPLAVATLVPSSWAVGAIAATSLIVLAVLGGAGASLGGAPILRAVIRVVLGGLFAMLATAGIGHLMGTSAVG